MKTVQISLNSIDKVKSFVNDISKFDFDFVSGIRKIRNRRKIHHGNLQPRPFQTDRPERPC